MRRICLDCNNPPQFRLIQTRDKPSICDLAMLDASSLELKIKHAAEASWDTEMNCCKENTVMASNHQEHEAAGFYFGTDRFIRL